MKKVDLSNGARIILVDDISPEDVAMVQALYSRNACSAKVHLQRVYDELGQNLHRQATQRAAKFMDNYVVGYGHKSIADCGSTTLFFEGVSMLAAKAIQDWPLYSGQETSTRYLSMVGRRVIDPIGNSRSQEINERWMRFYENGLPRVEEEVPSSFSHSAALVSGMGKKGGGEEDRCAWMEMVSKFFTHASVVAPPFTHACVVVPPDEWLNFEFESSINPCQLLEYGPLLFVRPRGCVLPHWMTDFGTISCRFKLDFGSFRDIQRHRNGVCRMPVLGTHLGFHPWYLEQLDSLHRSEAEDVIAVQTYQINDLVARGVNQQYLVAMGFQVLCHVTYGLPAAVYVMELRSGKMIHPTLRTVIHKMIRAFQERHPIVKLHVDMDPSDWDVRRGSQTIMEKQNERV